MKNMLKMKLLAAAISTTLLAACGDAETTIIEKDPIEESEDDHGDHDHDHGDGDFIIDSLGRLAVLSADSADVSVFDLDDNELVGSFALTYISNALSASAGHRYAVISSRSQDTVGFIDGGLWREDHVEHLHDYEQDPDMISYELSGSRPTHVVSHDGQMAIFYDGDAQSGAPASVQVVTDTDITNQSDMVAGIAYDINMHGVAEPRGEHLLSTVRRDDATSTSNTKVLPDQVAVYHLHDGEYEMEQLLEPTCPDLHGAAQNSEYVAFGCGDGVLLAHQHDDEYEASKVANVAGLNGMRIGTIYGHHDAETFIGIASAHGGSSAVIASIDPEHGEIEVLEWQSAVPVSQYAFSYEGDHFLVLDSQGMLNVLHAHDHDGQTHWELEDQIDIAEQDPANMPEGLNYSMAVAQNGNYVYIASPLDEHIVKVDLETAEISHAIELTFTPDDIAWLGISEEH